MSSQIRLRKNTTLTFTLFVLLVNIPFKNNLEGRGVKELRIFVLFLAVVDGLFTFKVQPVAKTI